LLLLTGISAIPLLPERNESYTHNIAGLLEGNGVWSFKNDVLLEIISIKLLPLRNY
jgi:hypothetical protein